MRTEGQGKHYCTHCGFDCTPIPGEPHVAEEACPACDGDSCEPKRRAPKKGQRPVAGKEGEATRSDYGWGFKLEWEVKLGVGFPSIPTFKPMPERRLGLGEEPR